MGTSYIPGDRSFRRNRIGVQLKFVWIPKTCYVSSKLIWLEYAYKETAMYTGPDSPAFEYRWYTKHEYIIARLKGLV